MIEVLVAFVIVGLAILAGVALGQLAFWWVNR